MAEQTYYIGSTGPFTYDDAEFPAALQTTGIIRSDAVPASGSDVLRLDDLSAGVVAPSNAKYVVISLDGDLSDERVLAVNTTNLTLTDGGANGNITLDTVQNIDTSAIPEFAGLGIGTDSPGAILHISTVSDELLRLTSTSSPGSPYISFFQSATRRSFIQHNDFQHNLKIVSEYGKLTLWTGTGGSEVERLTILSDGNVGIGVSPNYKLSIGSPDGSDQIGIYHSNTNAYFKTTDGRFIFQTDEGTNTVTQLDVIGKGTGNAYVRCFSGASYGSFFQSGIATYFRAYSGHLNVLSVSTVRLQSEGNPVDMFATSPSGVTQELKIYGYRSGDALRSLQIGVGVDAADTASFDGVSNYYFDGNITVSGTVDGVDLATVAIAGGAYHDGFSDFAANEHKNHTTISVTAGVGLSGGGTIDATRTITLDLGDIVDGIFNPAEDYVPFIDGSAMGVTRKEKWANIIGSIAGSGINAFQGSLSVDVSDFMANGSNNRLVTATGADNMNAEQYLTFDGNILSVSPGQDDYSRIGRCWIGYNAANSDWAAFGHEDNRSGTAYAFMQNASGRSLFNSKAGQNLEICMGNAAKLLIRATTFYVGIWTTNPGQIFDVNQGSGDMIADGYDFHSLRAYKENINPNPTGFLDKLKSIPFYEYRRIPHIPAEELKAAAVEQFGQEAWVNMFPSEPGEPQEDDYHGGKLRSMPDGEMKQFINAFADTLREERRLLPKWEKKHFGIIADDQELIDILPEVVNEHGTGINLNNYVGFLHGCILEQQVQIEALQGN